MKKIFYIFLFICFSQILFSLQQESFGQSQFQLLIARTDTSNYAKHQYANCIIQTSDGGYAVAGTDYTLGVPSFYIVKLTSSCTLQWGRTVGGTNPFDIAYSIVQTKDGGYAVTGESFSFGPRMYIIKLDGTGMLQWSKTITGSGYVDGSYSVIQTIDGGYAIAGFTAASSNDTVNMYIVKLDSSGSLQWSRVVRPVGTNQTGARAFSIIQTTDGGYAAAGTTSFSGSGNFYIVKLSSSGTFQWSRTIESTENSVAFSIIQTNDGGYAVAGYSRDEYGMGKFYIVKLDSSGSLQWTRTAGGASDDKAYSIIQTADGGYSAAGYTYSFGGGYRSIFIVKLNDLGTLQWSKTVESQRYDGAYSIIHTIDGGYAVAGSANLLDSMNIYIVKFDSNWNTCGSTTTPNAQSDTLGTIITPASIITTPNSIVMPVTPVVSSGGTVNILCLTGINNQKDQVPSEFKLYQNYPNPFNPSTKIKFSIPLSERGVGGFVTLKIYDILGREVATLLPAYGSQAGVNEKLKPGSYEVNWDGTNYPSGVYFYKLTAGNFTETKKMVLLK